MGSRSSIEWTESTWNPVTGCTKVSPGCKHCYAERMALRLRAMGQPNYVNGFKLTTHEHMLELPLRWKKPQMIFVEKATDGLCQFDERPFPRGRTAGIHPRGL
jgi:protein gp37